MCWRRGLKVNAGKNKMMVLNGEGGLCGWGAMSEFKYLECVLDESGTDEVVSYEGGK